MYRWDFPHPLIADGLPADKVALRYKCLIAAIMKNEGPYIVEWACYQYALGFREILVFSNFCDDLSDRILDRLDDLGIVRHRPHPKPVFPSVGQIRISALRFTKSFGQFHDSDYFFMTDVDEFLEVFVGDHDLNSFFDSEADFEVASFLMRGRSGEDDKHIDDGLMLPRFKQSAWSDASAVDPKRSGICSVKSLARTKMPGGFQRNHRPMSRQFSKLGKRWIDGGGRELPSGFTDRRVSSLRVPPHPQKAVINHYATRSAEGFIVKMARGAADSADRSVANEKALQNWLRYWTDRKASIGGPEEVPHTPPLFEELHAQILSDPVIAALQEETIAIHRSRAQDALNSENGDLIRQTLGLA